MRKKGLIIKIIAVLTVFALLSACAGNTATGGNKNKNNNVKKDNSSADVSSSDNSYQDAESSEDTDDSGLIQKRPWQSYIPKNSSSWWSSSSSSSSSPSSSSQTGSEDSGKETEKCPYTKAQLMDMLKYLTFDEADRYAVGVGCGTKNVSRQISTAGGAPVTFDFEMSCLPYSVDERQLNRIVTEMVQFTQKGGIICATNHWLTPTTKLADSTQQGANNSRQRLTRAQYLQVVTPGNQIYENFREELAYGAEFFKKLEDAGVPVVYRPMHEANGAWFWWGVGGNDGITGADVAALYRYVHDYYVKEKGLSNIIWCFCTALAGNHSEKYSWWSEGNYIDIASTDWYLYYGDYEGYYNGAQSLADGMPFAMSEFGWDGNGWNSTNNATWNKNIPDVLNRIGWNSEIADKYAKLGWDIKKLNACQTPLQVTLSYLEDRMERCGAKCAYVGLYFDFDDNQITTLSDKCITLSMMPEIWKKVIK